VVLVSHRLQEVLEVADDFTVYRDGRTVASLVDTRVSEEELVRLMAGQAVTALAPSDRRREDREVFLQLAGVTGGPLRGVDLVVGRGEIVGLAGLVGSGRSAVLRTIFGEHPPVEGRMTLQGRTYAPADVPAAMESGVAMVPEDRGGEAAFPDLTVVENLSVSMLGKYWRPGGMARAAERSAARSLIDAFGVKVAGPEALFSSMSGGNQQKVILARWLQRKPALLLLDEPTQGVDVMSRVDIYELVRRAAEQGTSVLVASSDPAELSALCDRVLLLREGRVVEALAGGGLDPDTITAGVLRTSAGAPTPGPDFPVATSEEG
jgi:ribose transport system ATP-binding protein